MFIMLWKGILFESVDEILKTDHSNESYWAVLSCGSVYYAVQGGSNFESVDEILKCDHSNFLVVMFFYAVQGGSYVWVVDKILQCDHSNVVLIVFSV